MEKNNFSSKEIIERLAILRTQKKMSAYKLGMMLGHSKTYIYRVENGEIQLTLDRFLEILEALGVTTTEFFCKDFNAEDIETIKLLNTLQLERKELVIELINCLKV
jgi:transcriptional regulator with XRE-family HTH domain